VKPTSGFRRQRTYSNVRGDTAISILRVEIKRLQAELGITTFYVTHDQAEAMTLGERIAVMKDGLIRQVGPPMDVYQSPADTFVAGFIGTPAMNFFAGRIVRK